MLAGPPRLISLVSVLVLFILAWSFLRLDRAPYSSIRFGQVPSSTSSLRGDPLDFGIPLRFKDGEPRPAGTNYTWSIVIPKTKNEDLRWLQGEIPEAKLVVYEVDNPNAEYKIPKNKGREAMVYLSYMIDHYDDLPDTTVFMHAHHHAWHNNLLLMQDALGMLKRLNHDRVARLGYMNVRCHHEPGCPDWIHLDRPGGDFDFFRKPEEIYWRKSIWEEIHPGAAIPASLSGVCCAQFALSRDRIREVPIERLLHYRKWLLNTGMDDTYSGRVFEYIWHYIFTGHEVYCPAQNTCYCDGYGVCFGGRQKYEEFEEKTNKRNTLFTEFDAIVQKKDKAKEEGKEEPYITDEEQKEADALNKMILELDQWLETKRKEAFERGEDEASRKEERESYDSSRIWDYGPPAGLVP
ncbi:uncharacterized protein N0V89_010496 [Didymosphaeria variabile]|uniref:Uncharacterized protein n=1 Tax=Didymosphaeria variabile TaxID=1932322 RepID=A0A9W9C5J7_9PLEO|nr:uncharacterized protein N0V89_010496 [Didymosphaeria variabile]KAJ4346565.1 hypothetical protein N0V89_010496 [Didymosphaeria variabile]